MNLWGLFRVSKDDHVYKHIMKGVKDTDSYILEHIYAILDVLSAY